VVIDAQNVQRLLEGAEFSTTNNESELDPTSAYYENIRGDSCMAYTAFGIKIIATAVS
jgi:hypothetical protein